MKHSLKDIAYIAYHEAGHVVINYYLGWKVEMMFIMQIYGKYGGANAPLIEHDARTYLLDISPYEYESLASSVKSDLVSILHDKALVLIAGQSAENIYTNKPLVSLKDFTHYGSREYRTDVVKLQVIEGQLKDFLNNDLNIEAMIAKCNNLLKINWDVVQALAEALLSSDRLGIDQTQIELLVTDIKSA